MNSFLQMAHERWSCRAFTSESVSHEQLEQLVEAALAAPTGCNYQPFHLWVIRGDDAVAQVRAHSKCHFGAPAFVVVGADAARAWQRPYDGLNVGGIDASIVATHLMLEAWELGLGTCWVAHFDAPAFKRAFPQMKGYELIALFPVGHPAPNAKPLPLHFLSKEEDELCTWL